MPLPDPQLRPILAAGSSDLPRRRNEWKWSFASHGGTGVECSSRSSACRRSMR